MFSELKFEKIDYMLRCNINYNYTTMTSVIIGSIDLHNITNRESFSGLLWSTCQIEYNNKIL